MERRDALQTSVKEETFVNLTDDSQFIKNEKNGNLERIMVEKRNTEKDYNMKTKNIEYMEDHHKLRPFSSIIYIGLYPSK